MAIQAQPANHRPLEVSHEPVGKKEGAGARLHQPLELRFAREHLVAVGPSHAGSTEMVEERVESTSGSAISIHDDHAVVARLQRHQLLAQLVHDAVGIEVQHRGEPVDVNVPATPVDDVLDLAAKRAADDEGSPHPTGSSLGNCRALTNVSLKSVRPDSSTYSSRAGSSNATWRSRYERSAILAPSPAELPTAMMRSTSTGGTRPMIFALSGLREGPKEPPGRTSSGALPGTPRTRLRTFVPRATGPLANCR